MSKHFHLLVETPRANLVAARQCFLGTYTTQFNRLPVRFVRSQGGTRSLGACSAGATRRLGVGSTTTSYLNDGVRLGPFESGAGQVAQAGAAVGGVSVEQLARDLKPPDKRWPWLRPDRLLGQWGVKADNAAGPRQLEQGMQQRKQVEWSQETSDWKRLRRDECSGPRDFRERMLQLIGQPQRRQPHGQELRESEAQKAQRLVEAMLRAAGWTEMELHLPRKGEQGKLRMAVGLRAETTMS